MIQILNWKTNKVIFEGDYPTIKDAVEAAVKQRVSLAYADLSDQDLSNGDFRCGDFRCADFRRSNLKNTDFSGMVKPKVSLKQKLVNWLRRTFNF